MFNKLKSETKLFYLNLDEVGYNKVCCYNCLNEVWRNIVSGMQGCELKLELELKELGIFLPNSNLSSSSKFKIS